MIEIKISANTAEEALSDLRAMTAQVAAVTAAPAEPYVETPPFAESPAGGKPPRTTKAHQDKPADPDPVPEAVDKPAATVDPAPAATTKPISKEDVRAAGRAAANLYGAAIVKDVLKRTGAPSMSDIPEDKRAAFIEELKKLGEKNA